jgi:hypothetical protein
MTKFKALVQFSYNNKMYNNHGETYDLKDDVVQTWANERYVQIIEEKVKLDKKEKGE